MPRADLRVGMLVEGEWRKDWYDTKATRGHFVRQESGFREHVTTDGASGFPAEAGSHSPVRGPTAA